MTTNRRWWLALVSIAAVACGDDGGVGGDGTETGGVDETSTSTSTTTTGDTETATGTGTSGDGSCGDGVVGGDETCDDGNTDPDDGCSADCMVEVGWSCEGEPSTCSAVCGDGNLAGEEACDDGNTEAGDGCSDACAEEPGWYCDEEPSVCATMCGDDIAAGEEACDGTDLLETTCFDLGGAADGALACDAECAFDIEGCLTFPGDLCIDPFAIDSTDFSDDDNSTDYNPDYGYGDGTCPGEAMGYGAAAPDVVYLTNSPADGTWRFELSNNWDSTLYVVTNCADIDNACVGAHELPLGGNEMVTALLTADTNYYVIVDGFSNMSATNGGNYNFTATRLGDNCGEPNVIDPAALPFTFNGDTTLVQTGDYTADMGACGVGGGDAADDAAFSFTAEADGDYQITVTPTGWDALVYAAADCGDIAGTCSGGANDGGTDAAEQITVSLTAGDTVFVVVDGVAAADEGPYELYIESI